jgi:ankyrin repeat protein
VAFTNEDIIILLELPAEAINWKTHDIAAEITRTTPDLDKITSENKNILHLLVKEEPQLLKAVLNLPHFKRELLDQKDCNGKTPLDILEALEEPVESKFQKKYMLLLAGSGFHFPSSISLYQGYINQKIKTRLILKNRSVSFLNEIGLCQAYSFLHNYYLETLREDFYYTSLLLMRLWDESLESLQKPLPSFLPQSALYKNLDELFEQWTNDLFLFFGSTEIQSIIPDMLQSSRHLQFNIAAPKNEENTVKPVTLYYYGHHKRSNQLFNLHYMKFDSTELAMNKKIAQSRSQFRSVFITLIKPENPARARFVDLEGNDIQFTADESISRPLSSRVAAIDRHDLGQVIFVWRGAAGILQDQSNDYAIVTLERMKELLKYLCRLPEGVYIDVDKTQHSSSFRKLANGNLYFYNCDDGTKTSEIVNFSALHDKILLRNGHLNTDPTKWEVLKINKPHKYHAMCSRDESVNNFIPLVYHFNNPDTVARLDRFHVFFEEELPHTLEDVIAFQQASPCHFTHLHIALITHDLGSVKSLLDQGLVLFDAQDAYGRRPLDIAIANGFIEAALMILDKSPSPVDEVDADWFVDAFQSGHSQGFQTLLSHPKLQVNLTKVAAAAMQNHVLEIVYYLLSQGKIHPNTFIQSAILAKDLPLIELLLSFGANPDIQDKLGNTVLHYAACIQDDSIFRSVLKNSAVCLFQKNNQGQSVLDIIAQSTERTFSKGKKPEREQSIVRMMIESVDFQLNNKAHCDLLCSLLDYTMHYDDDDLFSLALEKTRHKPEILNKFISRDGMKMTLLHQAILENHPHFVTLLIEAGANPDLKIRQSTPAHSTNPLIGKSARDITDGQDALQYSSSMTRH